VGLGATFRDQDEFASVSNFPRLVGFGPVQQYEQIGGQRSIQNVLVPRSASWLIEDAPKMCDTSRRLWSANSVVLYEGLYAPPPLSLPLAPDRTRKRIVPAEIVAQFAGASRRARDSVLPFASAQAPIPDRHRATTHASASSSQP
jgi:hypothetical protein